MTEASRDINTLREHLFDAIDGLNSGTVTLEKAKAISEVSQTIINTAKVEVELAKATGQKPSGFIGGLKSPENRITHRL